MTFGTMRSNEGMIDNDELLGRYTCQPIMDDTDEASATAGWTSTDYNDDAPFSDRSSAQRS